MDIEELVNLYMNKVKDNYLDFEVLCVTFQFLIDEKKVKIEDIKEALEEGFKEWDI